MKEMYAENYRLLGKKIKILRQIRDMSQKELGALLDIDQNHVSRIECAYVGISLDMLFDIASALNVKPGDLLEFSDIQ